MNKIKLLTLMITALFFTACQDEFNSNIPNVRFRVTIDLNSAGFLTLLSAGSSVAMNTFSPTGQRAGYAGLIIYNAGPGYGYYAFDRCCTHHPIETHPEDKKQLNPDGAIAVCPYDGSEFILSDGTGSPLKNSTAKMPLRRYNISLSGYSLTIYNN